MNRFPRLSRVHEQSDCSSTRRVASPTPPTRSETTEPIPKSVAKILRCVVAWNSKLAFGESELRGQGYPSAITIESSVEKRNKGILLVRFVTYPARAQRYTRLHRNKIISNICSRRVAISLRRRCIVAEESRYATIAPDTRATLIEQTYKNDIRINSSLGRASAKCPCFFFTRENDGYRIRSTSPSAITVESLRCSEQRFVSRIRFLSSSGVTKELSLFADAFERCPTGAYPSLLCQSLPSNVLKFVRETISRTFERLF